MVFFNYATMQMAAKIVYYGPGLCGKTTNLHQIYAKTSPQSRGEMVSLETETDRTLFFDLLPIDVGVIGGFKTRLQLYTVPGQVFYNAMRKQVLKGVDGIVFVADSQKAMLDANVESLKNLRENLAELKIVLDDTPVVIQLNKRDLPNVADRATMIAMLDPHGQYEYVESSAVSGQGVFETLKLISKLTLKTLRRRMMGDEPAKALPKLPARPTAPMAAEAKPAPQTPAPALPKPVQAPPSTTDVITQVVPPPSAPPPAASPAAAASQVVPAAASSPAPATAPTAVMEPVEPQPQAAPTAASVQPAQEPVVAGPTLPSPAVVEPEVNFSQTEKPPQDVAKVVASELKRVKVRSSVDIFAELDTLRKSATQSTGRPKRESAAALDALSAFSTKGRKDLTKNLSFNGLGSGSNDARRAHITVTFEDGDKNVLASEEQFVELEKLAELQSLQFNLKVGLGSGHTS